MVISCAALGCKNRQNSLDNKGKKMSFHRFPRDKDLCQIWVAASKRSDFIPTKYSYLCSEHFAEDQFNRTQKANSSRLRANAIPTIFKGIAKHKKKALLKTEPRQVFDNPTLVKIAPKQTFDVQSPIKIAPKLFQPNIGSDILTVPDTVLPPDLIGALNAFRESRKAAMPPEQANGSPMSILVVHPQMSGTNFLTVPSASIRTIPTANVGTVPTASVGTVPTINFKTIPTANVGTIPTANIKTISTSNVGFVSASNSHSLTSDDIESSSDAEVQSTPKGRIKIKRYEERIKNYQREVKVLQQQNRRQREKIEKLERIIKYLRNPDFTDEEEDVSEDMSEEEIYAELLKYQSESENEELCEFQS